MVPGNDCDHLWDDANKRVAVTLARLRLPRGEERYGDIRLHLEGEGRYHSDGEYEFITRADARDARKIRGLMLTILKRQERLASQRAAEEEAERRAARRLNRP